MSVIPCRPTRDTRTVVEAYPALEAGALGVREGYKSDTRAKQTLDQRRARETMIRNLLSTKLRSWYGFDLDLGPVKPIELVDDLTADLLDAVLCAIQAAWAYQRREQGYGVPRDCDSLEGWIVDPSMMLESA